MSEQTQTFRPGTTLQIEAAVNGFIVREPHQMGRPPGQALVFNHLGPGLLAFLEQHFESDAERDARLQSLRFEAEVQQAVLDARLPTPNRPLGDVSFPIITGGNPAPFDGCLLKGCTTGLGPNGFATADSGKPA